MIFWELALMQLITIFFAISCAFKDAPAILQFEDKGVSNKTMAQFHRYGNWLKFFYCLYIALSFMPHLFISFIAGNLSFLIIYLVFDPAINWKRPGKPWYYLSINDSHGRFWLKKFGTKAGIIKAYTLLFFIIVINVLLAFKLLN